ncbi:217_t:CDS:2 [Cetraspora pellucida]|uniref:217_t:CDS:1 n=1 Tax=Cetraspora pellucida TaxID=1433469 RepID=A0A9N9E9Z6_9GLOM|nr:217_t:CDS:2 [Cetraspora pellucida]
MSLDQSKYPENNPFSLKQNNTNYKYHIINEKFYPPKNKVWYTLASSYNKTQYKALDSYLVRTSWGRNKSHHTVECEIEYEQDGPVFIIRFEENSQQYVLNSKKSPTAIANNYLKVSEVFDNQVSKFFNLLDQLVLQEVKFNVQDKNFVIDYNDDYKENSDNNRFLVLFLKVIEQGPISYHAYQISIKISIFTLNIENMALETSNIDVDIDNSDQEIEEEVLKYINIGNKDKTYKIEKTIDSLKSDSLPPGHLKTSLLPMICLDQYVPDELHIMLRIWDCLWELVIQEIKSENRYDNYIRMIISLEIKRISVTF